MTITGFKSTDIESRSKVEPATVTNFGYKRQGLDVNAMTGLFLVTAATCSAGTSSSIAVMSPASTVRAGDVLDFNGIRSEISLVSGTSYTLGRAVTGLTNGSSVNIYRPSYLLVDSTGAVSISGTSNINLAQVGGAAFAQGRRGSAQSLSIVSATAGTDGSLLQQDGLVQFADVVPIGLYSPSAGQWVGWDGSVQASLTSSVAAIGRVGHDITGIVSGRRVVTTAGTRVTLTASSTVCKKIDIVAEIDNTGVIVVGGSGVIATLATREGIPLIAGQPYSLEIDNAQDVWIDSTISGDGVTYVYYT